MNRNSHFTHYLRGLAIGLTLLIGASGPLRAAEPGAMMLVATPALTDPLYGATVLVAHPIGGGQFLGLIVNKPTTVTVAQAFPKHAPSQKVLDPIFVGGPERPNSIFALVNSEQNPGKGTIQLAPDLFLVLAGTTVDQVIENDPEHARFLIGAVLWRAGELESEIKRGAWYVEQPDTDLMMRKDIGNLWDDLVQRREARRRAI